MKKILIISFLFICFSGHGQSFDFLTRNGITKSMRVYDSATIAGLIAGKQPQLNGTGFVKATGTTISYDNNTYITSNIYSADGTLSAPRLITGGGNSFTINGTSTFQIVGGDFSSYPYSNVSGSTSSTSLLTNLSSIAFAQHINSRVGLSGFNKLLISGFRVVTGSGANSFHAILDSNRFVIKADTLSIESILSGVGTKALRYDPATKRITIADTTTGGGSGANALGTYLVQTSTNAPANAQIMASLGTGLVKNTTTTGVQSIATAGTDYITPTGTENLTNKTITYPGTASPAYSQGKLVYDTDNESLTFFNSDNNISLQVGQEEWIRVKNVTGSTIANGAAVYISGANSGFPTIALAQSNSSATTIGIGLTTESIANNATGYVTVIGVVHGLDTHLFTAGLPVFIDPTTPGALTQTAPSAPNYRYRIGIVAVSDASVGTIHVTPSTASLGNGTANQVFGMNSAATAQEVKSITGTTNRTVVNNSANTINIDLGANVALQDANKNVGINNSDSAYATTATAAGTTTLTVSSKYYQNFTGSTTQTVVMPAANTLVSGHGYYIVNKSTGIVTVNYNGGTLLKSMAANTSMSVVFTDVSTTTGVATVEYSGDVLQQNNDVAAFAALGGSIKAQTVGNNYTNVTATVAMADQQVKYCAIFLDHAATLTGVKVYMKTAGSYTGDQYNGAGLYTYSGGSLTLVASSTNSASLWTASANTILSIPFSSTYPAQPGIYFIGMLYNQSAQTTAPALAGSTAYTNAVQSTMDFTNSAKLYGTLATQNSLPSPQVMSGVTATTAPIWAALY